MQGTSKDITRGSTLFAFHLNKSAVTLIFKPLHFDDNGITGPD
jgi:hypothetical protein